MFRRIRAPQHLVALLGAALLAVSAHSTVGNAQSDDEPDWEDKPYTIVDGKVDLGTYNGFRRYHSSCHVCHGPDAMGSSYAPALMASLDEIGYEGYLEAVVNGIKNVDQSTQSVMPAFGEVEDVMLYVDDIYSYLKARTDGALGRGRPERLPKDG